MTKESSVPDDRNFECVYQFNGKVDVPMLPIQVSVRGTKIAIKGLLDTGSNKSCVTKKFANQAGMASTKKGTIIQGTVDNRPIYLLDSIILSKDIVYRNIEVMEIPNPPADIYQVLIGMDIINTGNLFIENSSGRTKIVFRLNK